MKNLNLDSKKLVLVPLIALGLVFFSSAFAQTASSDLPEGTTQAQITSALQDLSAVYGQPVKNVDEARDICNSEQFLVRCAEIGKSHDLYKEGEVSQINTLLNQIKGDVSTKLSQCTTAECFLNVAKELAEKIVKESPQLATQLDLTSKKVEEKRAVVQAAKEAGVDFRACQNMDPDSASLDLLRACARLARDTRVGKFISEEAKEGIRSLDSTLTLRDSLNKKEFSCGDNTLEGCGEFCLNPPAAVRAQGVAAISPVCRQIAQKFFGPEGVKSLEAAYQNVDKATDYYNKKAKHTVFTTPDGTTFTDPAEIGRYMEEQGRLGNVEAVEQGLDFMVSNGFVSPDEKTFALKMIQNFRNKGGPNIDFDMCQKDPESCADFIPQEFRAEFDSANRVKDIMSQKLGFDPRECGTSSDESVRKRCFEAARNALPELESLPNQSREVQRMIAEMREHTRQDQAFDQSRQSIQQQGGPGGCKNQQECFTYCSDPAHGPECLSFGAKSGIFRGNDVIQRYQEYNNRLQAPQFSGPKHGDFTGTGPYPGFQPPGQGGFPPPGQIPGFTQPGPGFGGPTGGPSPECFIAIQSGDFVRAKELCSVPSIPKPIEFQPTTCPSGQYWNGTTCMSSTTSCSSGQTWDGTKCVTYNTDPAIGCVQAGGAWDVMKNYCNMPGTNPMPPDGCPSGQHWDGTRCVAGDYSTDPAIGCRQAGGAWDSVKNYCNMPGTTNCSSGQYWDYNTKACVTSTSPSGQKQQTWNSFGLSSQIRSDADSARIETLKQACANVRSGANIWMPGAGDSSSPDFGMPNSDKCKIASSCSSTQYFDGANCVSSTTTTCPSGQYWNGNTCMSSGGTGCGSSTAQASQSACLAISGCTWFGNACAPSTSTTTCPSGQHMYNGACVADSTTTTTTCPSGQYWYTPSGGGAGSCVSNTTTTCPSGQHMYNGACVADSTTTTTTCPSGQYWDTATSTCKTSTTTAPTTCPSGQHMYNGACVADSTTTTTTCPSGQYWNGTACVANTTTPTTTTCPSGYHMGMNNACEPDSTSTTSCGSGMYWNGSSCVSSTTTTTPTTCPSGQHMYNGACVADSTTTTPPPTTLNINFFLAQITQILNNLLLLLSNGR